MQPPSDLVAGQQPPSDLVQNQPPSDLVAPAQPPQDLVAPKDSSPKLHWGSGDRDQPLPDTPAGHMMQRAREEVVSIEDMITGLPGFMAKLGVTGAADIGMALGGQEQPLKAANEFMAPADQSTLGKGLQAPISALTGINTEHSTVNQAMGGISQAFDRAAEYWSEKTGNPEIGRAVKQSEGIAMAAGADVALKGVSEIAKKVVTKKLSIQDAKEISDLAAIKKELDTKKAAKEAADKLAAEKKVADENKAWGYRDLKPQEKADQVNKAYEERAKGQQMNKDIQEELAYKQKAEQDQKAADEAKGKESDVVDRTPAEDWGNPDQQEKAITEARDSGVQLTFDEDGRINPTTSRVDWNLIKSHKTVGSFIEAIVSHLPLDYQHWLDRIYDTVKDLKLTTHTTADNLGFHKLKLDYDKDIKGNWTGKYAGATVSLSDKVPGKHSGGNNLETILHELLHGATAYKLYQLAGFIPSSVKEKDSVTGKDVIKPTKVFLDQTGITPEIRQAGKELTDLFNSIKDIDSLKNAFGPGNKLKNEHELISAGLTHRGFQKALKEVYLGENNSAFSAFANKIARLLGFKGKEISAFEKLIDITDRLGIDKPHGEEIPEPKSNPSIRPEVQASERASKLQEGKADPELMIMLGAGAIGATAFTALTANGNTTLPAFIGKIIEGGGIGILLAKAPSAWRDYSHVPREQFMTDIAKRHGSEMREAAGVLWDKKTPESWKQSSYGKNKTEKYLIEQEVINKGYRVDGAAKASLVAAIKARRALTEQGMTEEMAKAIYDIEEGKEVSKEAQDWYDKEYKPVVQDLSDILTEMAGVTGRSLQDLKTDFYPRMALDKRTTLQKLMEGDGVHLGGKASSSFGRTLFAVDTAHGPMIVHVGKDGTLTGFHKGEDVPLGKGSKPTLGEDLLTGEGTNLGKLREATKNEVEEHSDTKYWNDAMSVALIKRAEAQAYLDQMKFFRSIKDHPALKHMFIDDLDKAPAGWKPLSAYAQKKLPMFRNYAFSPRLGETIQDMLGKEPYGPALQVLEGINNMAMKNLLLNPIPHIDNEITHYFTAKGLTNWLGGDPNMNFKDAWDSVRTQDDVQLELMKQGMSTLYTDRWVNNNIKALAEKQMEVMKSSKAMDSFALQLGMKPIDFYASLSGKTGDIMWSVRDTLITHLVQGKIKSMMDKSTGNLSRKYAVRQSVQEVMKDMPSYRLPPRIAEEFFTKLMGENVGGSVSRGLSQMGSSQLITPFFRYHYAVASELANIVKEIAVGTKEERLHALDKAAALVAMSVIIDNMLNPVAQMITGDEDAKFRMAGPLHLIERGEALVNGDPNAQTYLMLSLMSPPMWTPIAEVAMNKTIPLGKSVTDQSEDATTQLGQAAEHITSRMLPQAGMFGQATGDTGETDWNRVMAQQMDIKVPSVKAKAKEEKEQAMEYRTGLTKEERAAERKRRKAEKQ